MQKSENVVKELMEKRGYDVILNDFSKEPGIPDFKCVNFETGEKFYLEVKLQNQQFNLNQIRKIKELLSKNQLVRIATVYENKIDFSKLKSDFSFQKIETIKYEPEKTKKYYIQTCKVCKYRWESRVSNPKACPKCKRYDWKEKIKILAIVIFSLLFIPSLVQAASWTTLTQSDFNLGTYFNTTYNTTGSFVMLNNTTTVVYSPFGNYTSKVFDASTAVQWNNISWVEGIPYGEQLPNNTYDEIAAGIMGGANMTGNVLLLHLNSVNSTNRTLDTSGNGNDGRLYNYGCSPATCNITSGLFGNSLKFDGSNDYVDVAVNNPSINMTSNITVALWFKLNQLPSEKGEIQSLIYRITTDAPWENLMLYAEWSEGYNMVTCELKNSTSNAKYPNVYRNLTIETWYFAACMYNGTHGTVYVNNQKGTDALLGGNLYPADNVWRIGANSATSARTNGTIDEVIIFNRTLTRAELLNLYKRGALRLNITTRSCDDSACSGEIWNQTHTNATSSNIMEQNNRYFQYKANFEADSTSYTPELYNVTINYTPIPFTISTNATTAKRGDFINITISSALTPTANMTKPNGSVIWLTTPVSKGNNIYETNYTFADTDPSGSYRIGINSSTDSNTTNITMNSGISVTLESDKMSATRKISTRSSNYILVYGTTNYDEDGSACSGCTVSFTYDNNLAGSNTTNSVGSYNFTFSVPSDGNYSFRAQATDSFNNTGSNVTIMSIKTRPEYVKFRLSYALGTTKENDVYKIGTAGNVSGLIDGADLSILQYSSNLTHGYVCAYDNTEYSNGLSISLIHSYKSSYLDYVNFSASSSNTNYTLELRNKIDGSNLILAYTKGTCDNIDNKMYLVEKQSLPSTSFSTFSYGGPSQYPYEIRTDYDRIQINGSDRWATGSFKLCIQKTGVSSANKPIVDVGTC